METHVSIKSIKHFKFCNSSRENCKNMHLCGDCEFPDSIGVVGRADKTDDGEKEAMECVKSLSWKQKFKVPIC